MKNMKKYIINNVEEVTTENVYRDRSKIAMVTGGDSMSVTDGYHTMDELYGHRITLFIALTKALHGVGFLYEKIGKKLLIDVWRSRKHSDGELAFGGGWFVLGIYKEKGKQITYHIPIERWNETEFAETLETAPEFDGHTSADVLERLKTL